jgi:glucan phosphoethanolaminetransferase (alkaline phosphatase superfamily)
VLSLAITNLAAWMGIAVTPMRILKDNDFDSARLIYTGLALGLILVLAGLAGEKRGFKKHFTFTYTNFGANILFISGLAGLFRHERFYIGWFLLLLIIGYYFYRRATRQHSFYFLLLVILYTYIALSYVVLMILDGMERYTSGGIGVIYLGFIWFILSAIGVVRLLITLNRKMKTNDSI